MWEWEREDGSRIVKRVSKRTGTCSHQWEVTLYWKRGTFCQDGTPLWVRYIRDVDENGMNTAGI